MEVTGGGGGERVTRTEELGGVEVQREVITDDRTGGGGGESHEPRSCGL